MNFEQAVKQTANEFVAAAAAQREPEQIEEVSEEVVAEPVDVWQTRRDSIQGRPAPRVRGASKKLLLDLDRLLDNGIERAYKKAVDDSELLRAEGELQQAQIVEQQYMQEEFLPIVDALIRLNSQEEVLASQEALATLDALALVPGGNRADGYTSMFVSSLYEPVESQQFRSDIDVMQGIARIDKLADNGQMRPAITLAKRLVEGVDMGNYRATPEDYEFLQGIALRG